MLTFDLVKFSAGNSARSSKPCPTYRHSAIFVKTCSTGATASESSWARASDISLSNEALIELNSASDAVFRTVSTDFVNSYRSSVTRSPIAAVMPGCAGEITSLACIISARATACNGPAPPNPIREKFRGSTPFATEFELMASAILLLIIFRMPIAASVTERPSLSAIWVLTAVWERLPSIFRSPPRN